MPIWALRLSTNKKSLSNNCSSCLGVGKTCLLYISPSGSRRRQSTSSFFFLIIKNKTLLFFLTPVGGWKQADCNLESVVMTREEVRTSLCDVIGIPSPPPWPGWREHSRLGFEAFVRERKSLPHPHFLCRSTTGFIFRLQVIDECLICENHAHESNIIILIKGCTAIKTATTISSHHCRHCKLKYLYNSQIRRTCERHTVVLCSS